MQRYKLTLEYDGTEYVGFQFQKNGYSVQEEIERALKLMTKGLEIPIFASGRTDSGVHALGQVIHLDYPSEIKEEALVRALNAICNDDIRFLKAEKVEDSFHARYHAQTKKYLFRVSLAKYVSPFSRRYVLHHPHPTNPKRIQEALNQLIGTHDFKSFCSTKSEVSHFVRTLTRAEVIQENEEELLFTFEGDGFLYNMIRIIVGTSLQIGDGLKPVEEMTRLLEVKDRNEAGPTAGPSGLYMAQVDYPDYEQRMTMIQAAEEWRNNN